MKPSRVWSAFIMILAVLVQAGPLGSQEAPDSAVQADRMAQYMELAQPGPEHHRLEALEGTWKLEAKMWMVPDSEPMVVSGKATHRMILGGRFLLVETKAGEGFTAVEGLGILGFDRGSGQYTSVGYNTWGTHYVTAAGIWDEDSGAIVMSGEEYDAVRDFTFKYDYVLTLLSPDTHRFEVILKNDPDQPETKPFKRVEELYTRLEEE